ncbi:hypothetical protein [Ornithinimicrobium sp. INDO-MA30-4]|uniref:hypothetical protein n=1 Tax=Ornithinimicrobium sp. INDO-MA30-4 TaxID=2908651 RepID=UPI001F2FF580|nr:hypothetical protein [Ornithinimicrobium sp. INDO-MA30-4]UJH70377.1 hypothetical protein L0A91_14780 [Ornithinimicrobium sp. INDO-MA30-4]
MTTFYTFTKDSDPAGPPIVAVDHEDRVYFYLGNTKLWHHSVNLEIQLDTNHRDWTATKVSSSEAATLIAKVKGMDGRGFGGDFLREYKAQPPEDKRTNAEVGLHAAANDRPFSGGGLPDLLRTLQPGVVRDVARYQSARRNVAHNLAYEINEGTKKSLQGIP